MALQHVEGTVYKITYTNNDYTNHTITVVGGYSPESIWSIAECLITCVKTNWFNEDNSVYISSIEAIGDNNQINNPG